MKKYLSIKAKILFIFATAILGFTVYLCANAWSLTINKSNLEALTKNEFPASQKIKEVIGLSNRIEDQFQLAVTTGDLEQLENTKALKNNLIELFASIKSLSLELESDTNENERLFLAYYNNAFSLSESMIDGTIDFSNIKALADEKSSKLNNFRRALNSIDDKQGSRLSNIVASTNNNSRIALISGIIIGVVTILVLSIISISVATGVTKKLHSITSTLQAMTNGAGDLHMRLPESNPDEIGLLVNAFNAFIEKLQHVISEVIATAEPLDKVARELNAMVNENTEQVSIQRQASSEASNASNEMNENIATVAENSQRAAGETNEAMSRIQSGQQLFSTTTIAIERLANDIESASSEVARLESDTNSVGVILDVIRGIAEQTNLLALNAAIEAARAGEQGRGFAVVADEVRSLASKTQDSTEEINSLISRLQQNASIAAESMLKRTDEARTSVTDAKKATEHLEFVVNAMANVKTISAEVAAAVDTEKSLAERIAIQVGKVDAITDKASHQTVALENYSNQLQLQSAKLKEVTDQFSAKAAK